MDSLMTKTGAYYLKECVSHDDQTDILRSFINDSNLDDIVKIESYILKRRVALIRKNTVYLHANLDNNIQLSMDNKCHKISWDQTDQTFINIELDITDTTGEIIIEFVSDMANNYLTIIDSDGDEFWWDSRIEDMPKKIYLVYDGLSLHFHVKFKN